MSQDAPPSRPSNPGPPRATRAVLPRAARIGLAVAAVCALSVVLWAFSGAWRTLNTPKPQVLARYVCPDQSVVHYRHGWNGITIDTRDGSFDGIVLEGSIEWRAIDRLTQALGGRPPVEMTYDDPRRLHLVGGGKGDVDCMRAPD